MFFRKADPAPAPAPDESAPERRAGRRVHYPAERAERRPVLFWAGGPARVLECSTRGLRVEIHASAERPRAGDHVKGRVEFHASTVAVDGIVRYARNRVVGVALRPPGIPLDVLRAEERQLAERLPRPAFTR